MQFLIKLMLLLACTQLHAHEEHTKQQTGKLAVSLAFDAHGDLWRAAEKDGYIWLDTSHDLGKTFSKPVQVNPQPQKIGADGEARPKIEIGPQGHIYITWTEALKKTICWIYLVCPFYQSG